jgi:CCR4-NOT transcription complex subunit 9
MQQMQHLFTQQQQQHYPGEWSQGHHQHPNHHVAQHGQLQAQAQAAQAQAQAQAAAAAAAAAQAQQQHYQRIAGNNGTAVPGNGIVPRGPANDMQANTEIGMTEENRRVLDWIAQLMKPATRESALLELSKKREQVPELALILWHSFGKPGGSIMGRAKANRCRRYGLPSSRNHLCLPSPQSIAVDSRR